MCRRVNCQLYAILTTFFVSFMRIKLSTLSTRQLTVSRRCRTVPASVPASQNCPGMNAGVLRCCRTVPASVPASQNCPGVSAGVLRCCRTVPASVPASQNCPGMSPGVLRCCRTVLASVPAYFSQPLCAYLLVYNVSVCLRT